MLGVETLHAEFVPVLMANDKREARFYKALLEGNNIPVVLESERGQDAIYGAFARAVPILVPENLHDRASHLVAEAERNGVADLRCGGPDDFSDAEEETQDDFDDELDDDDVDDGLDDLDDFEDEDEFEEEE